MTGLAVYFQNIPGALIRVLNCVTRRGLLIEAVWSAPLGERHRATLLFEAPPITVDQIVRELESTVGVEQVKRLEKPEAEQLAARRAPEVLRDNGSTLIKACGPPEENRFLIEWLGATST